jgi:arylsulfatase A-like enzyme
MVDAIGLAFIRPQEPIMPRPTNVLLITSDHMRADFIAAHGASWLQTPNLDRLVNGGVTFRNCFAQNPVCMPSRASFLTSCYPAQTGVDHNGPELPTGFEPTLPQAFSAANYFTGHIGKLHLQDHYDHDLEDRPAASYGFQWFERSESRGCYRDSYLTWLETERPEHVEAFRIPRASDPDRMSGEVGGTIVDAPWTSSHAGWLAARAATWYDAPFFKRAMRPNFLHLGFHHPHPPLNPTREAFQPYDGADIPAARWDLGDEAGDKPAWLAGGLRGKRTDEAFREYRRYFAALVTEMDLAIGAVLENLERLGVLDNTLIVFTSDHGDMCGDHRMTHKGPHFYDEVMRVPLVMHWPEGLGTGRRDEEGLVELTDLAPTMLDLCGVVVPEYMQGRSWAAPLLDGETVDGREDVYATNRGRAMVRTARGKYIMDAGSGTEVLYDYEDGDAHERRNHAEDPAAAQFLADMRKRCLQRQIQASASVIRRERPF